ncbi:hypothetical protein PAECIP111891_02713 [Paenibacillus allorhizoplanae]|uniref:Uncharacterized protein n=1 Tax=Paenibacillus allorhizoplanae TaxID=2905648 RepID=A0ABN8GBW8_9BACL|nr:hypothetical protein [Paenibacillus allorhizoplanae]CAH1205242.1 hypothetical protein PAECIP111891_02713 [Paenibacillus allorhizoplanae]
MQELEKKQITPVELAAAMMQFTMKSIENSWDTLKPAIIAYLPQPVLTMAKEDELLRDIYIAALALEIYCIPHAFEEETARLVSLGMGEVMASDNLAEHRLSEAIVEHYLPRLEAIAKAAPADLALELVQEAAKILYERIELPLKPADPSTSLLWAKLFPFLAGIVGKWPILATKFEVKTE